MPSFDKKKLIKANINIITNAGINHCDLFFIRNLIDFFIFCVISYKLKIYIKIPLLIVFQQ